MKEQEEREYESLRELWKKSYVCHVLLKKRGDVASTILQWLLGMAFRMQEYIPKTKHKRLDDGQTIDINWRDNEALSLSCCDCGLVHYIRLYATNKKIRMRLWRDVEETKAQREDRGIIYTNE